MTTAKSALGRMRTAPLCEREVYVGTTIGGESPIALWGYVDAVFQCDDGSYAIVDFKTDSVKASPAELAQRYGIQLNAYGVAVEQSTGATVSELWLLVADPGGIAQQVLIERAEPQWPQIDPPAEASAPIASPAQAVRQPAALDVQRRAPEQLTLL